jgi:hypothetical protein
MRGSLGLLAEISGEQEDPAHAQGTIGALGDDEAGRLIKHALERLAEHLR